MSARTNYNILPEPVQLPLRVLRLGEVAEMVGLPLSSIKHKHLEGSVHFDAAFPVPIALTAQTAGWYQHELVAWLLQRPRASGRIA